MKDVRRRPVKEQEVTWEGENRDRCLDRPHEAPSQERLMRRNPARHAFSRRLVELSTTSNGSTRRHSVLLLVGGVP